MSEEELAISDYDGVVEVEEPEEELESSPLSLILEEYEGLDREPTIEDYVTCAEECSQLYDDLTNGRLAGQQWETVIRPMLRNQTLITYYISKTLCGTGKCH